MKQRVIVMNGQRVLQAFDGSDWSNKKVSKAGDVRPGVYNLSSAKPADLTRTHTGPVVHMDEKTVYQDVGRTLIAHAAEKFTALPKAGESVSIEYSGGIARATAAAPAQAKALGRKL